MKNTCRMRELEGFPIEKRMLPMEMLERVFRLLCPNDLKAVMLVCKRWNEAGSVPKLWSWVVFKLYNSEQYRFFREKIRLPRLQAARKIQIEGFPANSELKLTLLGNALSHPGLKQLVIHGGDFRTVEPNLLANFLTKMEEVDLSDMLMSTGQRTEFLSALKETNKIKRFSWQDNESEDRLAAYSHLPIAMKKIEKLTLKLNLEQSTIQSLFKVLAKEEASVKSLSLDIGPVDHINPVLLSGVVAKLEEVDLTGWKLTEEQCISICSALSDKPRLRKLICDCGWAGIEQLDMHVKIVTALEELEMARLSGLHQKKMLADIARDPGRLRKLVISHTNLGAEHPFRAFRLRGDLLLEGMVLSKLARKLVELDLGSTSLKAVQLEEFMVSVARSPGKLKNLILQGNDLERVDAGVIARMATKIESLNIAKTELSSK